MIPAAVASEPAAPRRWWTSLYVQVLTGIALGILLGALAPAWGASLKWLGDLFIKLVKMVIAPVIFLTVTTGIAGLGDLKGLGRVVGKAFGYFVAVSTLALFVGLAVGLLVRPGAGLHVDRATLDAGAVADYAAKAQAESVAAFLSDIVPTTLVSALTDGNVLQVLLVAILTGVSLVLAGEPAAPVRDLLERLAAVVFRLVGIVMRAAPVGAFAAMAFTVGRYGVGTLANLLALVATFYATSALFVAVVLGLIARAAGFSLWRLLVYLRAELVLVLGTSSSEAALPNLMAKLEDAGCAKGVVGLVVPTGYSFNLDGTNIYMTLAALFIAQALDVELSAGDLALLLGVAVLSSKGAAGVTGAGFITLAATLAMVPSLPVAGMALVLGVDRFMSECRSLTNFIGNAVATIVVARWEGALDRERLAEVLGKGAADTSLTTDAA